MVKRMMLTVTLAGLLITLAGCVSQASTATPAARGVIVLSEVSGEPSETIEDFQPLANYLAAHLGEFGIGRGEVRPAPDLETMAEWMESGEVNLYFDSLYPALIVANESGARPILRRWKGGVGEYRSVFFALADSGLTSVGDLRGRMVAFEEAVSTSGYMLPTAYLIEAGLNPVEKAEPSSPVGEGEVGYVFSGDHVNTIQWVVSGLVAAGVVDNQTFSEIPEETREGLVILAETENIPRHVVLVNPDMDGALVEAIIALLTGLDETEEGQQVLESFEETAQFDEFPEGLDAALARMQELYDLFQGR